MTFTQAQIEATIAYRDALRTEWYALLANNEGTTERGQELGNLITHFDFVVDKVLGGTQWKRYERNTGLVLQAIEA